MFLRVLPFFPVHKLVFSNFNFLFPQLKYKCLLFVGVGILVSNNYVCLRIRFNSVYLCRTSSQQKSSKDASQEQTDETQFNHTFYFDLFILSVAFLQIYSLNSGL